MRLLPGRLAGLIGLVCLLAVAAPLRAADGPIQGGAPSGGTPPFSAVTSGTNTNPLVIGSGGSMLATGTGSIVATGITTAALRASFEGADVIDVDPAEGGSVSAGLQEALARCNSAAGRCILQLRADTTYTLPARSSWGDPCALETNGADGVWIRGHGAGSLVTLTDNTGLSSTQLICVEDGSNDIVISDFKLVRVETCTTNCAQTQPTEISMLDTASFVLVERMQLYATEATTTDAAMMIRNVWVVGSTAATPDTMPRRVWVRDNDIQIAGRGIEFQTCDHCWAMDNYFNFVGAPTTDTTTPGSIAAVVKYEGVGVVLSGNIINMRREGIAEANWAFGQRAFWLISDAGNPAAAATNRSVQIVGNSVEGMRGPSMYGVQISGYDSATIEGNYFQSGQCSASAVRSCYVDEDCADLGGICTTSTANGIYLSPDATDSNARNVGNLIASNIFDGFQESGSAACPVNIPAVPGSDATENTANRIQGNLFKLSNTTDDGICGDAARIALNSIAGNYVVGATFDCLAGSQSAACQFSYSRSTEEFTVQELIATERLMIPHSITLPATCTVGESYMDTDATTGQRSYLCEATNTWVLQGDGGAGGGEANTYSSSGGGLAIIGTKTGVDLPFSSLAAADFDLAASVVTIDDTKWATDAQAAALVPVAQGGTGITSGTSGGIPTFTGSTTIASSGALTAGGIVLGGGAGAVPTSLGVATNGQIPIGDGTTAPVLAAPTSGDATEIAVTLGAGTIAIDVPTSPTFDGTVTADTGFAVTAGCTMGTSVSCPAHATDGGKLTMLEGLDDGSALAGFTTPNSGLTGDADYRIALNAIGDFPGDRLQANTVGPNQIDETATYSWSVDEFPFVAAGCDGASAGAALDLPASGAPTPACYGTTAARLGALDYADGSTTDAYAHFTPPSNWNTSLALDVDLIYSRFGAETSNAVRWSARISCQSTGDSLNAPTWETATASNDTVPAQYGTKKVTFSGLAKTACAAGETILLNVQRVGGDGGDTFTGAASLLEANVRLRRTN